MNIVSLAVILIVVGVVVVAACVAGWLTTYGHAARLEGIEELKRRTIREQHHAAFQTLSELARIEMEAGEDGSKSLRQS